MSDAPRPSPASKDDVPPDGEYVEQARGDRGAYERYLAGMDASMQQKVALTAAHLLCLGRVADMGMGSGAGSKSLAALYPGLRVVGVDVNPTMVELARDKHRLPNLEFMVGDIAQAVFDDESLDGILDSSVLHHVTSFGGYDHDAAGRALAQQVQALRPGGVLVVRDFLAPGLPAEVLLDVPTDDGDDGDDPRTCSSAALLERLAREFRPLSDAPGFALTPTGDGPEPPAPGRRRYRLAHRHAIEFILRKDYRTDWESEVKEEYTYFDQPGFERELTRLGMRMLASTPIRNPWIVANRFVGRFALRDAEHGTPIETPATNYVVVGERVSPGRGVRFDIEPVADPPGFLGLEHWRDTRSGHVMDLVRRPHLTIDALPWFVHDGDLRLLVRMSYPRPILRAGEPAALDGSRAPGWVTEPLTVIQDDKPLAETVERALEERAGVVPALIRRFAGGPGYFPSPGGVLEEVRSCFVHIDPVHVRAEPPPRSGFSTSGRVAAVEARQLLRAAQVGGLPDARLEIGAYALLRRHGRGPGPWIGAAIEVPGASHEAVEVTTTAALQARAPRRVFVRAEPTEPGAGDFLELRAARFVERDARGHEVAARDLEYVQPGPLSCRTVACALLRRTRGEVLLGLDDHDLPAAQCIAGHSSIWVAPAWRLPRSIETMTPALGWLREQLAAEFDVRAAGLFELGGRYHPSTGVTPEVVHPLAVVVQTQGTAARALHWVPLRALIDDDALLADGHLRIVALRAAHALGLLSSAA